MVYTQADDKIVKAALRETVDKIQSVVEVGTTVGLNLDPGRDVRRQEGSEVGVR